MNKLVRDTEKGILAEYNMATSGNLHAGKISPPVKTSSKCMVDGLVTSADLSLKLSNDDTVQSENVFSKRSSFSVEAHVESETEADKKEFDSDTDSDGPNEDLPIRSLKYWATSYSVSLVALSALSILRIFHPTLPKNGRTLLGTKAHVPTTKIEGGEYFHFGLVKAVLSRLSCLSLPTV